jgi:uncharacterized membrane protein YbhN (UPF0104 family)
MTATAGFPARAARPVARRRAAIALRVAVVIAAMAFLARGIDWRDVASRLAHASLPLLAVVVALNGCMMAVKAARLRLLLGPGRVSFRACFAALLCSSALNNVTPLRGGDLARLWMLQRQAGVTKSAALGVALVERSFEMLALAAFALGPTLLGLVAQRWVLVAAPAVAAVTVALLLVLWRARASARLAGAARVLRGGGTAARALALSLAAWTLEAAMIVTCARAIALPIGAALAPVILLAINLAIVLPSTPASAGPFESAVVLVLGLAGIAKGPAVAFAFLYHAVQVAPVTLAGLAVVTRNGLTLGGAPAASPATAPAVAVAGRHSPAGAAGSLPAGAAGSLPAGAAGRLPPGTAEPALAAADRHRRTGMPGPPGR